MSTIEPPSLPPSSPPPSGSGGYNFGTAWTYGWRKFVEHAGKIVVATLVLVAVLLAIQLLGFVVRANLACSAGQTVTSTGVEQQQCGLVSGSNIGYWLVSLVGWVVSLVIGAGIVRGALDIVEGRELSVSRMLTPYKLGQVVVASLLVSILTFVGFALLIVPGLIVMFFTAYTLFFLMDDEQISAIDAITESFYFTRDHAGNVLLWFLISIATWTIGACLCGVGLIVAIPVILIGTAYTFRTLDGLPVEP